MAKALIVIAFILITYKFILTWISLRAYILIMVSRGIKEPNEREIKIAIAQVVKNLSNDIKQYLKL